jgi:Zn-dependent protease
MDEQRNRPDDIPRVPSPSSRPAAEPTGSVSRRSQRPTFRWSWKLVTLAGIGVHLHVTFVLLIAFVAFSYLATGQGVTAMLRVILLILAVFTAVVMHEFGHALMARHFGIGTRDITLLPIGGVARLERMPDRPREQLLVALAGPAVNGGIALLLLGLGWLTASPLGIESFRQGGGPFLAQLMWINVSLALFNLLPGYPMDGGRVLRALLAMRMAPERATQAAARVGQATAVLFGLVGLFWSPFLVVIAVFVWLGAQVEHSVSTMNVALTGLSVRDGMVTSFETLSPTDRLGRAVELTLAGFQQDFPVMEDGRVLGLLTQAALLKGLAEQGAELTVQQAMRVEFQAATPSEPLVDATTRMHQSESRVLMVIEGDGLVGLLTPANVFELVALGAAGRQPVGKTPREARAAPCSD